MLDKEPVLSNIVWNRPQQQSPSPSSNSHASDVACATSQTHIFDKQCTNNSHDDMSMEIISD